MNILFLREILIILAIAIAVTFICHRIRIPTIVGLFITGVIAGPYGLGLISRGHALESIAELGVVLLLFTIGIEFSLNSLLELKRTSLLGGFLQIAFTTAGSYALARLWGLDSGQAWFVGCFISLSSTAIVMMLLQERAEVYSPPGRAALGILIFQDIAVIPMMLLIPLLAGNSGSVGYDWLVAMIKGVGVTALVFFAAKQWVPRLLYWIAATRSREIFLLSTILICLAVAGLTAWVGLSLALGAFLAGLIISESEYSHQALGNILPFRDVFTSFFFVSIGMLLDLHTLFSHWGAILSLTAGIMLLKFLLAGLAILLLGFSLRQAAVTGFLLCQVGEFSFILAQTAQQHRLIGNELYQTLLISSVLSMAAAPFIINYASRLADWINRLPWPGKLKTGVYPLAESRLVELSGHLVIIGFGINGRNLAKTAGMAGIPYTVIETNPETVKNELNKGFSIIYGDATQAEVLKQAGLEQARIAVAAISDPAALRRIIGLVKRLAPQVYLIVRTRYVSQMKALYRLGADEVIPEEFETSIEIFTRVLNHYLIPRQEIEEMTDNIRRDGYEMLRKLRKNSPAFPDLKMHWPDLEIAACRLDADSPWAHQTPACLDLRNRYGVNLLAVKKAGEVFSNPEAQTVLAPGDVLYFMGQAHKVASVIRTLTVKKKGEAHAPLF